MKTLVFIPLDGTNRLLETGFSISQIENEYNPGKYFDEVYVISPKDKTDDYGTLKFIKSDIAEIGRLIREIQPVAVRANAGYFCCDVALACRVKGIPIMVSVHDTSYERIRQSLVFADKIVCISNAVRKSVETLVDIDNDQILTVPRYVDNHIFKKKYNKNFFNELDRRFGEGKHIIHVGRKSYQKNIETTIEALKYLSVEYKLIQIGLGDADEYKKVAKKFGVFDRCFFIGGVPREELSLYYSWADCMCTPSRWEGFGLVFIEACACECPVITSNIGPMNEFLTDNESALLVDRYENPNELAMWISRICTDVKLRKKIIDNGKRVAYRYDINNAAKKEIENYEIMLTEHNDVKEQKLKEEIEKLNFPFVIYGAGENGMLFFQEMKNIGRKPICFIDKEKYRTGIKIDDVEIYDYDKLYSIAGEFVVVVTPQIRSEIIFSLKNSNFKFMEFEWYQVLLENSKLENGKYVSKWLN